MTETASGLDLARKVLQTEAQAILSLIDRIDGWAPAGALWGTAEAPQCR